GPAVRFLAPRPLAANLAGGRGQDERGGEQGAQGDEHQLPAVVGRGAVRRGQGVGGRRRDILLGRARGGLDGALGDAVGGRGAVSALGGRRRVGRNSRGLDRNGRGLDGGALGLDGSGLGLDRDALGLHRGGLGLDRGALGFHRGGLGL